MELDRAISQITEIHAQVLRSEVFRGYRALPVAVTGGLAVVAAVVQATWQQPASLREFLLLWIAYATVCCVVCGTDLVARSALGGRRRRREALLAVVQFAPAVAVGVLITCCLIDGPSAGLLPGLWVLTFGLGIFASLPYLPRSLAWVACFYLVAGSALLISADQIVPPASWALGLIFATGQLAAAWSLRSSLET